MSVEVTLNSVCHCDSSAARATLHRITSEKFNCQTQTLIGFITIYRPIEVGPDTLATSLTPTDALTHFCAV